MSCAPFSLCGDRREPTTSSLGRHLYVDLARRHDRVVLVAHLDLHRDEMAAAALDPRVDDFAVEERRVAREGGVAVVGPRMRDQAPFTGPGRDEVEDPRAHRGAVAVTAPHADMTRPLRLQ